MNKKDSQKCKWSKHWSKAIQLWLISYLGTGPLLQIREVASRFTWCIEYLSRIRAVTVLHDILKVVFIILPIHTLCSNQKNYGRLLSFQTIISSIFQEVVQTKFTAHFWLKSTTCLTSFLPMSKTVLLVQAKHGSHRVNLSQ